MKMKISICLIIISLFNACSTSHQIKRTYRRHTLPTTPVVPVTLIQSTSSSKDALKYFWEYADPISKLARERYFTDNPGFESNIVTTEFGFWIDDNYSGC
jgi:hypothetical protein